MEAPNAFSTFSKDFNRINPLPLDFSFNPIYDIRPSSIESLEKCLGIKIYHVHNYAKENPE